MLALADGRVSVGRGGAAVLARCALRGGDGAAVEIDPRAAAVEIFDCSITASGAGSPLDDEAPCCSVGVWSLWLATRGDVDIAASPHMSSS